MLCFRIMVQSQTILQYFTSKRQIFTSSRLISSLILLFFTYTLKRMIRCSKNLGTFASFYISLTRFKLLTDHSPESTMAHGLVKHLYLLKYHNICRYKNCSFFFFGNRFLLLFWWSDFSLVEIYMIALGIQFLLS